jgi:hypothetical protein
MWQNCNTHNVAKWLTTTNSMWQNDQQQQKNKHNLTLIEDCMKPSIFFIIEK